MLTGIIQEVIDQRLNRHVSCTCLTCETLKNIRQELIQKIKERSFYEQCIHMVELKVLIGDTQ